MKKYIDENTLNSAVDSLREVELERFSLTAVYTTDAYTDVTFDIYKDGYQPICAMPRTTSNGNVVIVGYGFGEEKIGNDVITLYDTITVTYHNLSDEEIIGTAKIDVVYIKV